MVIYNVLPIPMPYCARNVRFGHTLLFSPVLPLAVKIGSNGPLQAPNDHFGTNYIDSQDLRLLFNVFAFPQYRFNSINSPRSTASVSDNIRRLVIDGEQSIITLFRNYNFVVHCHSYFETFSYIIHRIRL